MEGVGKTGKKGSEAKVSLPDNQAGHSNTEGRAGRASEDGQGQ